MNNTAVFSMVAKIAARELEIPEGEITPDKKISELFDDSLDYMDFLLCLKEVGELSNESITKAETLGDLANAIVVPD